MAYSQVTDLLNGDIPLPRGLDPQKFVNDAADEIDGVLGTIYVTPIVLDAEDPAVRPSRLVLKRINNYLATGRLIMAADAGGQDKNLHAYALSLIKDAREALIGLSSSDTTLPGATPTPRGEAEGAGRGPRILNQDPHSNVDAFYDYFNPTVNPLRPVVGPGPTRWP